MACSHGPTLSWSHSRILTFSDFTMRGARVGVLLRYCALMAFSGSGMAAKPLPVRQRHFSSCTHTHRHRCQGNPRPTGPGSTTALKNTPAPTSQASAVSMHLHYGYLHAQFIYSTWQNWGFVAPRRAGIVDLKKFQGFKWNLCADMLNRMCNTLNARYTQKWNSLL